MASRLLVCKEAGLAATSAIHYIQRSSMGEDRFFFLSLRGNIMIRHLARAFSIGIIFFLANGTAKAQFGGLSVQMGGYGYGNSNYGNFGYGNPYYGNYGYNYPNYRGYYPTFGGYNNGYYNRGYNNSFNNGYRFNSPNFYATPQRGYSVRRFRRW